MSDQVLTFMSKDFKCKKCEHTFYSADALDRHEVAMYHNFQKKSKTDLNDGLEETALTSNLDQLGNSEVENTKYDCKTCGFYTHRMDVLTKHMKAAHKIVWNCEFCPYETTARIDLIKHQRASHKDFKCDQCDHTFYTSDKLARHMVAMNHNRLKDGTTFKRPERLYSYDRNSLLRKVTIPFCSTLVFFIV